MSSKSFYVLKCSKANETLEMLVVEPHLVGDYKKGEIEKSKVLYSEDIFIDAKKGDRASQSQILAVCGSEEPIEYILQHGQAALSTAEQRILRDQMFSKVLNYYHCYYLDPQTNRPQPLPLLEDALKNCRFQPDIYSSVASNATSIESKMKLQLALHYTEMEADILVPYIHTGKVDSSLRNFNLKLKGVEYGDTHQIYSITVIPGEFDNLIGTLGNLTGGDFVLNLVGDSSKQENEEIAGKTSRAKKGKKKVAKRSKKAN
eukprot:TRINITY_DN1788_c1_g1_i1.p2 TRINITY_DN1788_c1_g1~~TRINITY_DN1788_c1_g1_i1.p2  ORF type:complete len:260 (+),score=76.52 TRINITY_DN1788_c1_g1_i1:793-1572(+)